MPARRPPLPSLLPLRERSTTLLSDSPDIGWIGLGAMGLPMSSALLGTGARLTVYDINPSAVAHAVERGAVPATTAAETCQRANVLFVMVATPEQLDAVLFGDAGAEQALRSGDVVVVMATVGPASIESVARRLLQRGVLTVDAPVSGGVVRAGAGDLLIMASGPPDALTITRPLLQLLARDLHEFGDVVGDGQRVKLVNQLLCGIHIAAAAEALSFAESLGLDLRRCYDAVRTGAAASFMLDDRGRRMLQPSDEVRSALSIFVKDLDLVVTAGEAAGTETDLARTALAVFQDGAALGLTRRDDSRLIERFRQRRRTRHDP